MMMMMMKGLLPPKIRMCLCVLLLCDLPLISCLSKRRTRLRVAKFFSMRREILNEKCFAYMEKPLISFIQTFTLITAARGYIDTQTHTHTHILTHNLNGLVSLCLLNVPFSSTSLTSISLTHSLALAFAPSTHTLSFAHLVHSLTKCLHTFSSVFFLNKDWQSCHFDCQWYFVV